LAGSLKKTPPIEDLQRILKSASSKPIGDGSGKLEWPASSDFQSGQEDGTGYALCGRI
jgi:hypothetical protein